MSRDFYTFAEENLDSSSSNDTKNENPLSLPQDGIVAYSARIAIYDDPSMTPRVVVVDPKDIHAFLEEITLTVFNLAKQQGGTIPFMIIREVVENFIHAYFIQPTISILDEGNTIRFSDQGPGIKEKDLALEYGTSSATGEMKRYIRGVGSGLPNAQQYMIDHGGSLTVQDNISKGTIVTISTKPVSTANKPQMPEGMYQQPTFQAPEAYGQQGYPQQMGYPQPSQQMMNPYGQPMYPPQPMQNPQGFPMGQIHQPMYQHMPQESYSYQQMPGQGLYPDTQSGFGMAQLSGLQSQYPASTPVENQDKAPVDTSNITPGNTQENPFSNISISERGTLVLRYLMAHENVGPSDLVREFGGSQPTWSRELTTLDSKGLLVKDGQKRYLTEIGRTYLTTLR